MKGITMLQSLKIHIKKHPISPLIGLTFIFFIVQCFVIPYERDDTYFISAVKQSDHLLSFVATRYKE